ncbi:MAG: ThiF family adenylyltransferase, partial [Pseudomonadota bacterium]
MATTSSMMSICFWICPLCPVRNSSSDCSKAREDAKDEIERYKRHLVLHDVGGPGQQKLKAARVLVVGAGGLGSPMIL